MRMACARSFLDYGATIRSVQVPDRAGRLIDVVLGYDDLRLCRQPQFLWCDNRPLRQPHRRRGICAERKDVLAGENNGENHLHGGLRGFDKYVWQGTEEPDGVRFTRVSPDGEEGYPGTLTVP